MHCGKKSTILNSCGNSNNFRSAFIEVSCSSRAATLLDMNIWSCHNNRNSMKTRSISCGGTVFSQGGSYRGLLHATGISKFNFLFFDQLSTLTHRVTHELLGRPCWRAWRGPHCQSRPCPRRVLRKSYFSHNTICRPSQKEFFL